MTAAQRKKAERILLEQYIKDNPQIKSFLDNLLKADNVEINDILTPVIEEKLKEARMIGVNIGWQSAFLRCEEVLASMEDIESIKSYVRGEAHKIRESLSFKEKE